MNELIEAGAYVVSLGRVSIAMLRCRFQWGYPKAKRVITILFQNGVISLKQTGRAYPAIINMSDWIHVAKRIIDTEGGQNRNGA